ncbi:uncharacterized protein K452DRAFT_290855 [Aplosporella prunicola CBS 121167]|uniref:Uncharacterized protein n=1 Tax=Aplosporella prunicola CBS 121167 TaxID=1176127 RepID=A0A6A6B4D9_9PEZI|nr:uncharacterized protein K452DRAFT_290855 [Aplosporella prunicola CBS 121167]KAF2138263.1 hypothetical protein K452DRAFT_290855 [Aplosporella prunicola CBS 121167]
MAAAITGYMIARELEPARPSVPKEATTLPRRSDLPKSGEISSATPVPRRSLGGSS